MSKALRGTIDNVSKRMFDQPLPIGWEQIWKDIKWIVGLDIGGGNCSAYVLNRTSKQLDGQTCEPGSFMALATNPVGAKFTHSVIGYPLNETDSIQIGRAAANEERYQFTQNFKVCPDDFQLEQSIGEHTHRELITDFIRVFFDQVCAANWVSKDQRQHILLVVGRPSGDDWRNEKAIANYSGIIATATGVRQVFTLSESRAAIQYAQYQCGAAGGKNVLIFDLGAFSADATFVASGKKIQPLDFSCELGGKLVDMALYNIMLRKNGLDQQRLKYSREKVLFDMRLCKEAYYTRKDKRNGRGIKCPILLDNGTPIPFSITDEDMRQALNEEQCGEIVIGSVKQPRSSWLGYLQAFIESVFKTLDDNADHALTVQQIIITGGTANIKQAYDLIHELCEKKYGGNIAFVGQSAEDFFNATVAAGSVLYIQNAISLLNGLPKKWLELQGKVEKEFVPKLAKELSGELCKPLYDMILTQAEQWARGDSKKNLRGLSNLILANVNSNEWKQQNDKFISASVKKVWDGSKAGYIEVIKKFILAHCKVNYQDSADAIGKALSTFGMEELSGSAPLNDAIQKTILNLDYSTIFTNAVWILFFVVLAIPLVVGLSIEGLVKRIKEKGKTAEELAKLKELEEENARKKAELQRKKELSEMRNTKYRAKLLKGLKTDKNKEKLAENITSALETALSEHCEEDALGIPDAIITQIAPIIENAIFSA